jgi:uncharacterized ferritin-like protein (DUF455 family)
MVLAERDVFLKLKGLEEELGSLLSEPDQNKVPTLPGRDILVQSVHNLPAKMGLSPLGQQKLLHDLANIELQAMELGLRTLIEFPWTPMDFRLELADIVQQEGKHLKKCLESLESLGGYWGQWPVHLGLWNAVDRSDTLLQRLFIVHRYLEGSGLDAGDSILKRLQGVPSPVVKQTVGLIVEEEIGHVEFGNRWFRYFSSQFSIDERLFFHRMTKALAQKHKRGNKPALKLRKQAGFKKWELEILQQV